MKITKFVHSCLLIETADRVGLIDPGEFSWKSGLFNVDTLQRLDDIVITHEHFDHMHLPFIHALVAKFPKAQIITATSAAQQLQQAGVTNVSTTSTATVKLFATNHEDITPLGETPQNTGVHYLGALTHPGDSHHFDQTKSILALPITAPWGHVMRAATLGASLKPQYIIPIHDWHWREEALSSMYERLEDFFATAGITFVKTVNGKGIDLDI